MFLVGQFIRQEAKKCLHMPPEPQVFEGHVPGDVWRKVLNDGDQLEVQVCFIDDPQGYHIQWGFSADQMMGVVNQVEVFRFCKSVWEINAHRVTIELKELCVGRHVEGSFSLETGNVDPGGRWLGNKLVFAQCAV